MDTALVEQLEKRARSMLPAETVMAVECAADAGKPGMAALLEKIIDCGLHGKELCAEPCQTVVFDDRVLLRCKGCPRQARLPSVQGEGFGATPAEARRNALYALTLPLDKKSRSFGTGPCRAVETACIINRVAYRDV